MKALSLTQPWASLVARGAKRIETRSWKTPYRGPIAIHAAKRFPGYAKQLCDDPTFAAALGWPTIPDFHQEGWEWLEARNASLKSLPLGFVIATANLIEVLPTRHREGTCLSSVFEDWPSLHTERELLFGDYGPGRYALVLDQVKAIEPVPARGKLGLWDWEGLL